MRPADAPSQADERRRVADVYERFARSPRRQRSWSADNPGNVAIRAELVDAAFALAGDELARARDVLDIGCGSGWWLARLAELDQVGARLHGLELLPDRAAAAGARVPAATIATGDARELPYEDGRFDAVTLFSVLSSLSDPDQVELATAEARRVLARGGLLLVWEPRLANPLNRDTIFVSEQLLRRSLTGMSITHQTTTLLPALARRLGRQTAAAYPLLARLRPLRTHQLVCARHTTRRC